MIEIIPNWHPIFVHFTLGLLLTTAVIHVVAMFAGDGPLKQTLTHVANWNLWIGAGVTLATVAAGIYAFNTVTHDTPSHEVMLEHRNLALGSFVAFSAIAVWSFLRANKQRPLQWPLVIAVGAASTLLVSTAWHGGELVYRHGLGVMSLPNPANHVHSGQAHEHDHEGHTHEEATAHDHNDGHSNDEHGAVGHSDMNQTEPVTQEAQHEHADGEHEPAAHDH